MMLTLLLLLASTNMVVRPAPPPKHCGPVTSDIAAECVLRELAEDRPAIVSVTFSDEEGVHVLEFVIWRDGNGLMRCRGKTGICFGPWEKQLGFDEQ